MWALLPNKITPTALWGEFWINSVVMLATKFLIIWKLDEPILPDVSMTNITSCDETFEHLFSEHTQVLINNMTAF